MLLGLSIRDVVLIDRLDLVFNDGLSALTGETGAGKSILLDSLGLALGARSESGLVRPGAQQLSVTAEFAPPPGHPAQALLSAQSLDGGDSVILRRIVSTDGRSRAFVNDQPVTVGFLRQLGTLLVEIHGQFASHGLLDQATHRAVLDDFAGEDGIAVGKAWRDWQAAIGQRKQAEASLAKAQSEEDALRHAFEELAALDPAPEEEATLAAQRALLMHGEKLMEGMNLALSALTDKGDVASALSQASRALERVAERAEGQLDTIIAMLDRASIEITEAQSLLEKLSSSLDLDPRSLEKIEERLFALRALARKHQIRVDDLPALHQSLAQQLAALEAGSDGLGQLRAEEAAARASFLQAADALSQRRARAAAILDQAVANELGPLKLTKALFRTSLTRLDESQANQHGLDAVAFEVTTNPGLPPGPLGKIASGGELSRFMLALKVVLARTSPALTIVFDEVDQGIGGAVAAAVGERLAGLARQIQVLVVTHSPQVAAKANHHWHVAKLDSPDSGTLARVSALDAGQRREEIARMLAGSTITDQARAAADSLLSAGG
ncbi:MAG TPA: DNA repair protein RecN [Rhodospirillaceae bacterium]|nr:DNA repair protein RecN [Rhodospirillaceae bacterium]